MLLQNFSCPLQDFHLSVDSCKISVQKLEAKSVTFCNLPVGFIYGKGLMLQLLGSEMKTRMEMVVWGWGGRKKRFFFACVMLN